MCLIAIAPKGTEKYSDKFINAVKTGASTNKDGYGYCAKYSNLEVINFKKGFTDIEELLKAVKELNLTKDDELIIHCRTGNKGEIADYNCHPFIISDKQSEILELEGISINPLMVHNGTFFKYWEVNSIYSDTYHFVKQFMCIPEFIELIKRDENLFKNVFDDTIKINKLAFMFPDHDIITINDFIVDEGYKFSNKSYISTVFKDVSGKTTETKALMTLEDIFKQDDISLFSERNAYGIPVCEWTVDEIYFEKKESYSGRLLRIMLPLKELTENKYDYYWCKEINDDVISGKIDHNSILRASCYMLYKHEVKSTATILPLDPYKVKYTDYASLVIEDYTTSKNQMKKILKAFQNTKDTDSKIRIKGMKGMIDRSAALLYLKLNNHILKDSYIRNVQMPVKKIVKKESNLEMAL